MRLFARRWSVILWTVISAALLSGVVPVWGLPTPYSYYALDNNTTDVVGHRNGTLLGDATFSTNVPPLLTGYSTHSLQLDGTRDKMIYASKPGDVVTGTFTVAMWVDPQEVRPEGALGFLGTRTPSTYGFDIKFRDKNSPTIRVDVGNGSSFSSISDLSYPWAINQWHHIAVVVAPTKFDLYVDGDLLGSRSYSATTPVLVGLNNDLAIGSVYAYDQPNGPPYGEDFHGLIDDVRIYTQALTQAEIREVMNVPEPSSILVVSCGAIAAIGLTRPKAK